MVDLAERWLNYELNDSWVTSLSFHKYIFIISFSNLFQLKKQKADMEKRFGLGERKTHSQLVSMPDNLEEYGMMDSKQLAHQNVVGISILYSGSRSSISLRTQKWRKMQLKRLFRCKIVLQEKTVFNKFTWSNSTELCPKSTKYFVHIWKWWKTSNILLLHLYFIHRKVIEVMSCTFQDSWRENFQLHKSLLTILNYDFYPVNIS